MPRAIMRRYFTFMGLVYHTVAADVRRPDPLRRSKGSAS
jgi:hypothetical protein